MGQPGAAFTSMTGFTSPGGTLGLGWTRRRARARPRPGAARSASKRVPGEQAGFTSHVGQPRKSAPCPIQTPLPQTLRCSLPLRFGCTTTDHSQSAGRAGSGRRRPNRTLAHQRMRRPLSGLRRAEAPPSFTGNNRLSTLAHSFRTAQTFPPSNAQLCSNDRCALAQHHALPPASHARPRRAKKSARISNMEARRRGARRVGPRVACRHRSGFCRHSGHPIGTTQDALDPSTNPSRLHVHR